LITDAETLLLAATPRRAVAVHLRGLLHFGGFAFIALLALSLIALSIIPPLFAAIPTMFYGFGPQLLMVLLLAGTASLLAGMHQRYVMALFTATALLTSLTWL
jgi:hypothetical protein